MQLLRSRALEVVAAAFGLVCILVAVLAPRPVAVYAVEGNLIFIPVNSAVGGNALRAENANAVLFAAAVEREYNGRPAAARIVSTGATLYGIGVSDGVRVTLPSGGGQWSYSFDRPYLRVEVASPDAATSKARFREIVSSLDSIVEGRQEEAAVGTSQRVHLQLSPGDPEPTFVSGSRVKTVVAAAGLGLLGGGAILTIGRAHRTRRARNSTTLVSGPERSDRLVSVNSE